MFRKLLVSGALIAGAIASLAAGAQAQTGDTNCDNFPNQAAAQQHLRDNPSDPDKLDEDNDGLACENHSYPRESPTDTLAVARPAAAATTQPTTAVTRSGGVAETGPRDYVALLTLFGVVAVAVGVAMRGQRAPGRHWVNR